MRPKNVSRDTIPVDLVDADPEQPRRYFDPAALRELADSLAEVGLACPILVRPVGERFAIVHGERRWRAAKLLGWVEIPAEVRQIDTETAWWLALAENVQRSALTPMEEARAYQGRVVSGMTHAELAKRIGKDRTYVTQKLRLLDLPEPVALYLERGLLSEGHARQIIKLRGIYGGDWLSRPWRVADPMPAIDARAAALVLLEIRPEDNPPAWPGIGGDLPTEVVEACSTFVRWVLACGNRPPVWGIKAFWWASVAVAGSASVADLAAGLDAWRERFLSALLLTTEDIHCRYAADLRHGGVYDRWAFVAQAPADMMRLAWPIVEHAGAAVPSAQQPWGLNATTLESNERAEMVDEFDDTAEALND